MKVIDFPKQDTGPEQIAQVIQTLQETKWHKIVAVGITPDSEYTLIGGNVTLPDMLWLIERGKEIVLKQEGTDE